MMKVDVGIRPELSRWPLIEEKEWRVGQDAGFRAGLSHAFRYVQGSRMVVLNSGAGLTAGIVARSFPTANVYAHDLEQRASSTYQMAERNDLTNLEFVRKTGLHDVEIQNYFDSALLLDVLSPLPLSTGIIGAASRATRPGGRVVIVIREDRSREPGGVLPEIEVRQRLRQAALNVVHRGNMAGFGIYVAVKSWN